MLHSFIFITIFFQSIDQSQLTAVRQRHGSHSVFTRNRFRIRRDHILEDAYNQMSALSEDDLRGVVCSIFYLSIMYVHFLFVVLKIAFCPLLSQEDDNRFLFI